MGTAGLVGPIAAYASMTAEGAAPGNLVMKIILMYFVAPAIISLAIHLIMKRLGWIEPGDMKLGE